MSEGFEFDNIPESIIWSSAKKEILFNSVNFNDSKLREEVLKAVEDKHLHNLLGIIERLGNERKGFTVKISDLEKEISTLKEEKSLLIEECKEYRNLAYSPTRTHRRKNYPIQKIIETYEETKSLRQTAKKHEIDRSTVKSLLEEFHIEVKK